MDSQSQNTSLQRLQNVEKRIVRVLELAGGVTDELSNPSGPRKELVNNHCAEFMQSIKHHFLHTTSLSAQKPSFTRLDDGSKLRSLASRDGPSRASSLLPSSQTPSGLSHLLLPIPSPVTFENICYCGVFMRWVWIVE
ncbi:hypothetical protein Acr_15g0019110 [Actinidia rufa]|uniref:Mediator of RNA polymerase II transcription subunit 11 n=1 Tax=Actinidia rufa TaxID=165716 RepID=A0A7J0FX87_9ERIC|nr:hypothetical protein Acr_15g0019110 [Actinidia rufa]